MSDDGGGACAAPRARSAAVRIALVTTDGGRLGAKLPHPGAPHVTVDRCPRCGVEPGIVRGGARTHDHDTYRAPATALCCGAAVGTLEVRVETLFGIEEDEAVLVNGRARVYDGTRGQR